VDWAFAVPRRHGPSLARATDIGTRDFLRPL